MLKVVLCVYSTIKWIFFLFWLKLIHNIDRDTKRVKLYNNKHTKERFEPLRKHGSEWTNFEEIRDWGKKKIRIAEEVHRLVFDRNNIVVLF